MKKLAIPLFLLLLGVGCQTATVTTDTPQAPGCDYEGQRYRIGEIFPAADGCNSCSCHVDESVSCTEIACNPAECKVDADCTGAELDTSFCSEGDWKCVSGMCEFSCQITDKL